MKQRRFFSIILLIFLGFVYCYSSIIKGVVKDNQNEPLIGATVKLLNAKDSSLVVGSMIDSEGAFSLSKIKKGRYILNISMIGFEPIEKGIELQNNDEVYDLGIMTPKESSVMLDETIVSGVKSAVIVKEDTIEYNAGSYRTQPNAVVEDLLKKLPGVEVDADGKITSGGKTISKILIDGKEFFSDDPKMASKNLPSDMVDRIQIVDRKSDLARLTGVDDGEEETVINLTVKKGMQNGWFGTLQGGYGTTDRYAAGFNINHFKDGNQLTILGSANNINDLSFTDQGRGRFNRFGGQNGVTTAQSFGINFNVGKSEDLRFGGNVLYTHRIQDSKERSSTQYLFPDSTSYQDASKIARDKGHNLRADFRLQWNIDKYNTIDFRPRFSFNSNMSNRVDSTLMRNGYGDRVNHSENFDHNNGLSYDVSGDLIYNHKFAGRDGRSLSTQFKYQFSDTKEKGTSWNDIMYYLSQDDSELLVQFIDSHQWSNTLTGRFTWTEPLGNVTNGNFLNFAYKINYKWNNADRLTYDLPNNIWTRNLLENLKDVPSDGVLNETLSNSFRNEFLNQELQVGYKKIHKLYNLDAGILFSPSMTKSEDLINPDRNIDERWVWNVSPYMRFRYKFTDRMNFSSDYRARTSQPSIKQLQPVADVTNPLSIVIGNPNLKPTFTQNLSLRFNDFNADSQRSLMAMVNGSYSLNSIISKTLFNPETGGQTTTYANVDGIWSAMAMFMYSRPLAKSHWRMSAQVFSMYNSTVGYNNGEFNRSGTWMFRPNFGVTYSNDFCQISLAPQYGLQLTHNSIANQNNRTIHSYGARADVAVNLPFGVDIATDLNFSGTSGYSQGYNSDQWLWNAQVSYSTLKDKSLTFALKVYDLLQQKKNISRNVTANFITDREYNDLTRYFMFTVTWKFNTFGSSSQIPEMRGPRMGGRRNGPPPPPPGAF